MAKRIVWTEQAKADIRGIEQSVALQILKTLARYALTGEGTRASCKASSRHSSASAPRIIATSSATRINIWKFPVFWIARRPTADELRKPGRPNTLALSATNCAYWDRDQLR